MAMFSRPQHATRTKPRRLFIVAGVGGVIVASVVAVAVIGLVRNAKGPAQARAAALQAFEQGDHEAVVRALAPLLAKFDQDAEVLTAFGLASLQREGGPEDPMRSIEALRRSFSLDPTQTEVAQTLLQVFAGAEAPQVRASAIAYARHVVDAEPDRLDTRRLLVALLEEAQREDEAAEAAYELALRAPDIMGLMVLGRLTPDPEARLERYDALAQSLPDLAALHVARAVTLWDLERDEEATQAFEAALDHPSPTRDDARALDALCMRRGTQDQAVSYLRRVSELAREQADDDPSRADALASLYGQRAYELGRFDEAAQAWASIDRDRRSARDTGLLAVLRIGQGQSDLAHTDAEALALRDDDQARAWSAALSVALDEQATALARAGAWIDAAEAVAGDAHLAAIAAERLLEREDWSRAQTQAERAAALRPDWGRAYLLQARAAIGRGYPLEAARYAERAYELEDAQAGAVLLQARVAALPQLTPIQQDAVLEELDRQYREQPGRAWLARLRMTALAQTGHRERANRAARRGLETADAQDADAVVAWAVTAARLGLDVEEQALGALQRVDAAASDEPSVLMAMAELASRTGDTELARRLSERLAAHAEHNPQARAAWLQSRAEALEGVDPAGADAAWLDAADQQPDRLEPQRRALLRAALRNQPEVAVRLLERIDRLAGHDSATARTDRARVALTGSGAAERAAQALALLPRPDERDATVDSNLLRVRALGLLGRLDPAIAEAESVIASLHPSDSRGPRIQMLLSSMEQQLGRNAEARRRAAGVMRSNPADPGARAQAAIQWLALGGGPAEPADTLLRIERDGRLPAAHRLTLARLTVLAGRHAEAERLLAALLEAPTPEAIDVAVAFYGRRGLHDRADLALAKLDDTDASDAVHASIQSHALRLRGDLDGALDAAERAVAAEPESVSWRLSQVELLLTRGEIDAARAAASHAQQAAGEHPAWAAIAGLDASYNALPGDVVATIVRSPENLPQLQHALALTQQTAPGRDWAELSADLAPAHAEPALHVHVARRLLDEAASALEAETARELAEAASALLAPVAERFPARRGVAEAQARAAASAEDWPTATQAAQRWTRLDPTNLQAVQLEAESLRRANRAAAAVLRIERAFDTDRLRSEPAAMRTYALALAAEGRAGRSLALIRPKIRGHADARTLGLELLTQPGWSARASTRWLSEVQDATPEDAAERLALARAWVALALRHPEPTAQEPARAFVEAWAEEAGAPLAVVGFAGELAQARKDDDASERWLKRLIDASPDNADAHNRLATVLLRAGGQDRAREAARLANQAVELDPEHAAYWDTLGQAESARQRYEPAALAFRRAVDLDPTESEYRARLQDAEQAVQTLLAPAR